MKKLFPLIIAVHVFYALVLIGIGVLLFTLNGCTSSPVAPYVFPTTLEECNSKMDTIYVLDNHYYNSNGALYPPCSMSPNYDGCIDRRYKEVTK